MWWILDEYFEKTRPALWYWLATAPLSQNWKVWDGVRLPVIKKEGGETNEETKKSKE
ncbi:MAG: hypothetical protein J7J61_09155 [Candidatus Hydrothermae bacterium]|nr:hypothetical protein [Candidatus Hydrothermae bacterium]